MSKLERGTVLIQDGDDWVKVFVNDELVMEDHGHADHWKGLYVAAMKAIGAEVTIRDGYFENGAFVEYE